MSNVIREMCILNEIGLSRSDYMLMPFWEIKEYINAYKKIKNIDNNEIK
jgi:hypothetical protein